MRSRCPYTDHVKLNQKAIGPQKKSSAVFYCASTLERYFIKCNWLPETCR